MRREIPATEYEPWMRYAIQRALADADPANDEPPVGVVVIDPSGQFLASGTNRRWTAGDPTASAELVALREASRKTGSWRLDDCTVVSTLEPGIMSAGALVLARVKRLVIGSWDPYHGAICSRWDLVRDQRLNHRLQVVSGVLAQETDSLVRDYLEVESCLAEQRRTEIRLGL